MRFAIIFFLLFSSVLLVSGQVKVDGKATGKHARAIDNAKQAQQRKEEAKEKKQKVKEYKKKVKQHKNAKRAYKLKYDSARYARNESFDFDLINEEDSLAIAKEILEKTDFPPEYEELLRQPPVLRLDSSRVQNVDSVALAKSTALLESEAKEYLPDELEAPDNPLDQLGNPADGIEAPSRPNPNLIKPEKAQELFKQIDPEQFQEAQADIQKLKKKYSELPDTRYPDEGKKRNSLEDAPFKDRIYLGGNVSVQSTDPFILNSNLQLGYWINKKWLGGVGIVLREQFNNEDTTSLLTGDGYGYSFFTRYDIPKGFFAWAEVERQLNRSFFGAENAATATWQSAYLAGVGREFKIGFVQMISMILYDFNYRENDLNARPLVFKLGVRFTKKPGG